MRATPRKETMLVADAVLDSPEQVRSEGALTPKLECSAPTNGAEKNILDEIRRIRQSPRPSRQPSMCPQA